MFSRIHTATLFNKFESIFSSSIISRFNENKKLIKCKNVCKKHGQPIKQFELCEPYKRERGRMSHTRWYWVHLTPAFVNEIVLYLEIRCKPPRVGFIADCSCYAVFATHPDEPIMPCRSCDCVKWTKNVYCAAESSEKSCCCFTLI